MKTNTYLTTVKTKTICFAPYTQLTNALVVAFCLMSTLGFSQSQNWWRTNGNASAPGEFIGTTNASGINFKTNNITRLSIDANGTITFPNSNLVANKLIFNDTITAKKGL
jgi:hypothetical protein